MKRILFFVFVLVLVCGCSPKKAPATVKKKAVYQDVFGVDQILINKLYDDPKMEGFTLLKVSLKTKDDVDCDYYIETIAPDGKKLKLTVQCHPYSTASPGFLGHTDSKVRVADLKVPDTPINLTVNRKVYVSDSEWKEFLKVRR